MYHNQSTIFVGFFTQCVQFGDGIVKCLFGEMASSIGRIQNLVVEDGEIESKTEADLLVNTASSKGKKGRVGTGCVGGSSVTATSEAALYASRDLSALSLRLSPRANSAR